MSSKDRKPSNQPKQEAEVQVEKGTETDELTVRFIVEEGEFLPTRAYAGDAGLDLKTSEDLFIRPGAFALVPTGIRAMELPENCWAMIAGRSSTWKQGILVDSAIIDSGYRGDLFVRCFNGSSTSAKLKKGTRIAQLILMPLPWPVDVQRVFDTDDLSPSERGTNGFGSSGK